MLYTTIVLRKNILKNRNGKEFHISGYGSGTSIVGSGSIFLRLFFPSIILISGSHVIKRLWDGGYQIHARTGIRTRVGGSAGLQDIQATSCGLFDDINHCHLFQNKITIFIFAHRLHLLITKTHGSQLLPARFQDIIIYPEAEFLNDFQCLIF